MQSSKGQNTAGLTKEVQGEPAEQDGKPTEWGNCESRVAAWRLQEERTQENAVMVTAVRKRRKRRLDYLLGLLGVFYVLFVQFSNYIAVTYILVFILIFLIFKAFISLYSLLNLRWFFLVQYENSDLK